MSAMERGLLSPRGVRALVDAAGRPGSPVVSRPIKADARVLASLVRRGFLQDDGGGAYTITAVGLAAVRPGEVSPC